jgi:sugar O-acyltransferase (sialic acid O-acetyltransferase NeuD family)
VSARPVLVLGAGGNCRDIVDAMNDVNRQAGEPMFEPRGYLDDDQAKLGRVVGGVPVLGPLSSAAEWADCWFIDGLNGTDLTAHKKDLLAGLGIPADRWATVVHPSASVSRMAVLGTGTCILQNVTVNSDARIGDHVLVLPGSVISHDAVVDDYCYLTPSVVLCGYVHVAEAAYLGASSTVLPRVTIGARAVVGAGSVVLTDVAAGATVAGNPARVLGPSAR